MEGVPFRGLVSVPDEKSLPDDVTLLEGWQIVTGTRGLAAQRNAGLDALAGIDVVAFFDDDAVARPDYLANAVAFLDAHPKIVGITGRVLLDGKITGEIDRERTASTLQESATKPPTGRWRPHRELYGANFVVRISAVPDLRFDGRLPLYSWLEDHDFARRLMRVGSLAQVDDCVIVHRAAASGGRQSHGAWATPRWPMRSTSPGRGAFRPGWLCSRFPSGGEKHRLFDPEQLRAVAPPTTPRQRHGGRGYLKGACHA